MTRRKKLSRSARRKLQITRVVHNDLFSQAFIGLLDGPRWVVYSSKYGKTDVAVFRACFAAKLYTDAIIAGEDYEWKEDQKIVTDSMVTLHSPQLKEILQYALTEKEHKFELPDEYFERINRLRSDTKYIPPPPKEARSKSRHSRKGMILIKDLIAPLKISGREARGILRRAGVTKPDHGWAWRSQEEATKISDLLKEHTKK